MQYLMRKLRNAVEELTLIAGQKPVITTAKKSIAGFRLREGMPIGTSYLRRTYMNFRQISISITTSCNVTPWYQNRSFDVVTTH